MATIDPKIKALAMAIRDAETGGNYEAKGASGESGAYQWMPGNFEAMAGKYLGDAKAPMTRENQNRVAYSFIEEQKNKGLQPPQIASMWNSGDPDAYTRDHRGVNKYGVAYDTPAYVEKVRKAYEKYATIPTAEASTGTPQQVAQPEQERSFENPYIFQIPTMETTGKEGFVKSSLKQIANTPISLANFGIRMVEDLVKLPKTAIYDPIKEGAGLVKEAGGVGAAAKEFVKAIPEGAATVAKGIIPAVGKGMDEGLDAARKSVIEDPAGNVLPVLFGGRAGASRAGVGAKMDAAMSRVAAPITKPAEAIAKRTGEAISEGTKGAVSQTFGIGSKDTVSTIIENPEKFTRDVIKDKSAPITMRKAIGDEVGAALKAKKDDLEDVQKAYGSVRSLQEIDKDVAPSGVKVIKTGDGRSIVYNLVDAPNEKLSLPELRRKQLMLESDVSAPKAEITKTKKAIAAREVAETRPHRVKVSPTFVENSIKSTTGLLFEKGKLKATGESRIRDAGDVRALQSIIDFWKPKFAKGYLTVDELLNFRMDLKKAAKFEKELATRKDVEKTAGLIRAKLNEKYRDQVPGLSKLDEEHTLQISELERLGAELIDKDGNLLPTAPDRIANALGRTAKKDELLGRLEEIVPGVTKKIAILKALEDIQDATGIRVGTYTRGVLLGGTALASGIVPAIVTAILTHPYRAVDILRTYGALKNKAVVQAVSQKLMEAGGMINALPAAVDKPVQEAIPSVFQPRQVEKVQ